MNAYTVEDKNIPTMLYQNRVVCDSIYNWRCFKRVVRIFVKYFALLIFIYERMRQNHESTKRILIDKIPPPVENGESKGASC